MTKAWANRCRFIAAAGHDARDGPKTMVGVTDTEIKIGQSAAFSGPASVYGQISTAESDYFKMINEQGGINGRKLNLIALDDGYSPPKAIEVVRRLIEEEQVAILFQTIGTASNAAIRKYVNQKKVPDIWLGSGASMFVTDPTAFPWSIPFQPSYRLEAQMYAKYIWINSQMPRSAFCIRTMISGRDYVNGLKDGLGDKFDKMVVKTLSYEVTDPTIDSQVLQLHASGADLFFDASTPKFAAMSIRKVADIDWHPLHIIDSNGAGVKPALESAGFEKSVGRDDRSVFEGPDRSGVGRRRRNEGLPGLAGQVCAGERSRQSGLGLRLHDGPGACCRAETGRQRPVA